MTQEEFRQEARRLRPKLLKISSRYQDADDAEDTVQDVLLRLWQMLAELRHPLDPLATVLTRNLSIDQVRRRHPTTPLDRLADTAAPDEHDERLERIMAAMATLPSMQQTILRLRHMEGMQTSQIAELTGATDAAVRKALSRARQAIRNEYEKRYE